MSYQLIIILGFMGTGKTTVARELGRKLNCPAMDLDELITDERVGVIVRDFTLRAYAGAFSELELLGEAAAVRDCIAEYG